MKNLFESTQINGLALANRFVRSATAEGAILPNGEVSEHHLEALTNLAKGGVGLIIAGSVSVSPEGGALGNGGIDNDSLIEGHRRTTSSVHEAGGKIALQLFHRGKMTSKEVTGYNSLVVSKDSCMGDDVKEMDAADFKRISESFVQAAVRAKRAGYDAVQFHVAHCSLFHQILSPKDNRRTDEYGGTLEKRIRFIAEIIAEARKALGPGYPLLLKISSEDFIEDGVTLEDSLEAAKQFVAAGIDAIEVSSGVLGNDIAKPAINATDKEAYNRKQSAYFKEKLPVPIMLVGGVRSFEVAEAMLKNNVADYISLSRPLIAEPDLIKRWESGEMQKAFCKSCNGCFKALMTGEAVYCVARRYFEKKKMQ